MPIIIRDNMQIAFMKNGYNNYGLYIFEEPNWYVKVATFNSDKNAVRFMQYMTEMFDIPEDEYMTEMFDNLEDEDGQ